MRWHGETALTRSWLFLGAFLALLAVAGAMLHTAHGEPPAGADPALAPWFKSLQKPGSTTSCCDVSDCRTVRTRTDHGQLEAWIDKRDFGERAPNAWIEVPDAVVLHGKENPTGEPVLCYYADRVWCFVNSGGV